MKRKQKLYATYKKNGKIVCCFGDLCISKNKKCEKQYAKDIGEAEVWEVEIKKIKKV
jgi:hypothetical protein